MFLYTQTMGQNGASSVLISPHRWVPIMSHVSFTTSHNSKSIGLVEALARGREFPYQSNPWREVNMGTLQEKEIIGTQPVLLSLELIGRGLTCCPRWCRQRRFRLAPASVGNSERLHEPPQPSVQDLTKVVRPDAAAERGYLVWLLDHPLQRRQERSRQHIIH